MSPTAIIAYLALFTAVGFAFLFGALLLGRFLRANNPTPQKSEPYECGEPPVGTSWIQFDLRFYVVALVFLIFDVEVAFFFPWASVFGTVTQLADPQLSEAARIVACEKLGVSQVPMPDPLALEQAGSLALAAMADIGVFFGVLLVGFAYVWYRGDLNWIRAVGHAPAASAERIGTSPSEQ